MKKKKRITVYHYGIIIIIILSMIFYEQILPYSYLDYPTCYIPEDYKELDTLALHGHGYKYHRMNIKLFMSPYAYSFGYDLLVANKYQDSDAFRSLFYDLCKFYDSESYEDAFSQMNDSIRMLSIEYYLRHNQLENIDADIERGLPDFIKEKYKTQLETIKNKLQNKNYGQH